MNAEEAIQKLMEKQERMMAEAQRMTLRADKLKKVADFQMNFRDRRWVVDALDIDGLIARSMVLRDTESGILVRASLNVELEVEDENGDIVKLSEYIGGEEE